MTQPTFEEAIAQNERREPAKAYPWEVCGQQASERAICASVGFPLHRPFAGKFVYKCGFGGTCMLDGRLQRAQTNYLRNALQNETQRPADTTDLTCCGYITPAGANTIVEVWLDAAALEAAEARFRGEAG